MHKAGLLSLTALSNLGRGLVTGGSLRSHPCQEVTRLRRQRISFHGGFGFALRFGKAIDLEQNYRIRQVGVRIARIEVHSFLEMEGCLFPIIFRC